jgi:hypothetical protein
MSRQHFFLKKKKKNLNTLINIPLEHSKYLNEYFRSQKLFG